MDRRVREEKGLPNTETSRVSAAVWRTILQICNYAHAYRRMHMYLLASMYVSTHMHKCLCQWFAHLPVKICGSFSVRFCTHMYAQLFRTRVFVVSCLCSIFYVLGVYSLPVVEAIENKYGAWLAAPLRPVACRSHPPLLLQV